MGLFFKDIIFYHLSLEGRELCSTLKVMKSAKLLCKTFWILWKQKVLDVARWKLYLNQKKSGLHIHWLQSLVQINTHGWNIIGAINNFQINCIFWKSGHNELKPAVDLVRNRKLLERSFFGKIFYWIIVFEHFGLEAHNFLCCQEGSCVSLLQQKQQTLVVPSKQTMYMYSFYASLFFLSKQCKLEGNHLTICALTKVMWEVEGGYLRQRKE